MGEDAHAHWIDGRWCYMVEVRTRSENQFRFNDEESLDGRKRFYFWDVYARPEIQLLVAEQSGDDAHR